VQILGIAGLGMSEVSRNSAVGLETLGAALAAPCKLLGVESGSNGPK
jgi:hypothetical protein